MAVRIIPGAVSATSLRALVLTDQPGEPAVRLGDAHGDALPGLKLTPHASGDSRFDQHVLGAGVRLWLATADKLTPATDYLLNKVHLKTLPRKLPRAGVNIAVSSCYCDLFKRSGDYLKVLQGASGYNPLLAKFLVGDNLYLDVGPLKGRTPFEEIAERYLDHYWRSDYADVLGYLPTFTIWDDHEFWNNYPERQIHLPRINAHHADYTAACQLGLRTFQAAINPAPAARSGLSYTVDLAPLSVFALDMRSGRTSHEASEPRLCSEAELAAFERWAARLRGPGAVVVGQPLWIHTGNNFDWNPPAFRAQFARLWKAMAAAPWDIVILTGDIHHSHLLEIDTGTSGRIWQLTSSPVVHIPTIESIAARAFDVQDRAAVNFTPSLEIDVVASGTQPRIAAYHMGSACPNTLALLNIKPNLDGSVAFSGKFVDLVTKIATPWEAPPPGVPVAPGDHRWCSREPMFTLRRRPA
ncbi:MAG: hypothetical protein JNL82_15190 [Myxococcales bacterium]|nr:hypothetical protein [Myxococcales bacterium]